MSTGTADEVIFGSPELTDYFWTPEVLGKQVNLLRLNDAQEDEEEEEEEDEVEERGHGLSAAKPLPPAPALIPGEDLDTEGSDLLNLISTSLDRFNALLHTESACAGSASMPLDQQQGHQPQDCGIPIPTAYSQVPSHMNSALENFSNSVMRAWNTVPECPPHSVSPSSFFPGLVSSQHATQLLSKESLAAAAAAATVAAATSAFGKTPNILCSPPGLPRLAAASNHLFEMASSNDSNSTRSHLDNASACIAVTAAATADRKLSSNTCSSLSETPLWDSQWGQFPSEPRVQSTDSGFDSEHAFACPNWWSSATSQTASEQSDLRGCGAGADDPLSPLEFGSSVNRAGSCSTDGGGLPFPPAAVPSASSPSFNGFQNQEDQQLMQEVKAVVAAAAAAAAAAATFKSPLDVPPTSTGLRSALWASWPLSPTGELLACRPTPAAMDFPTGVSSSASGCCLFDSTQRQQVDRTTGLSSPGSKAVTTGVSSPLARYETAAVDLLQQKRQQASPSSQAVLQLAGRRKAASLSSASAGPGVLYPTLSACSPRSPSVAVGQLGSPPSQPRQQQHHHQHYEMQHTRHSTRALGPGSQKLGSKGRDQASRLNQFPVKPLSASLGSNCLNSDGPTLIDDAGAGSFLTSTKSSGHPRRTAKAIVTSEGSAAVDGAKPVIAKWRRACSFYLRGHCKKEDCEFAHDLTKVTCKFWELGECFKGSTCPFLHGYPPELLDNPPTSVPPLLLRLNAPTSSGTPVS